MMLHSVLSLVLTGAAAAASCCIIEIRPTVGAKTDCSKNNSATKVCWEGATYSLCEGSEWEKTYRDIKAERQIQNNEARGTVNFKTGACVQEATTTTTTKTTTNQRGFKIGNLFENIFGESSSSSGPHSGNDAQMGQGKLVECTTDNAVQVCMNSKCTKTLNIGGETNGNTQSCPPGESCIQFNGLEDCTKTTDGCHCEGKLAKTTESLSVDKKSKDPLSQWFPLLNMLWEMFWDMIRSIFG